MKGCFSSCLEKAKLLTLSSRNLDLLNLALLAVTTSITEKLYSLGSSEPPSFKEGDLKLPKRHQPLVSRRQLTARGLLGQLCSSVPEHSVTGGAGQSLREPSETPADLLRKTDVQLELALRCRGVTHTTRRELEVSQEQEAAGRTAAVGTSFKGLPRCCVHEGRILLSNYA